MRGWRALLWKESREELPKVLVGLGLCVVVLALRQNAAFNEEFVQSFGMWIAMFIMVYGGVLSMGLVTKESGKGTMSFLLDKPLSVVAAGAWATVYLDLEGMAPKGLSFYSHSGAWYPSIRSRGPVSALCC